MTAIICFLLYQIYKIKYTETGSNSMFIPQINDEGGGMDLKLSSRLNKMDIRISEVEDKLKEQGKNVRRLAAALSSG